MNQDDLRAYSVLVKWLLDLAESHSATTKLFLGRIENLEKSQTIRDEILRRLEAGEPADDLKEIRGQLADINEEAAMASEALAVPVRAALARSETFREQAEAMVAQLEKTLPPLAPPSPSKPWPEP